MSALVLGGDIGARGMLALLTSDGTLVEGANMPMLDDGPKGRRAVNPMPLAAPVRSSAPSAVFAEHVGARPGEAASGAIAFGWSKGVDGVLGACGVPARFIKGPVWKRAIGIAAGKDGTKDAARSEEIRGWPKHAGMFALVKDDGRAEARLIAAGIARGGAI